MYDLLSKSRILVIDDFAQFRQTIRTMLHKLGAPGIDQAANGVEALKLCLETDYDIILCDYNLGDGQDGQQFLEELHQRHVLLKGSLFLMVTAETSSAQVMGAIEYRPDAYLTKPFTAEQLGQRLKRLLTRNTLLRPIHQAMNANDNARALQLCDTIMQKTPNLRFSCLRLKSEVLEDYQRYDELLALYDEVISEQSLLWAELGIGKVYFAREEYAKALEHFTTMRDNFPRQVSIFDWIAKCQQQLGHKEEAEKTLVEAITISPKNVSRQATLGEVAQSLDHHETAHKAFERTIREGHHSCLLKPEYYRQYFENTRELASNLNGQEKSRLLANTENIAKRMERKYSDDPGAMAANLSSLVNVFSAAGNTSQADNFLGRLSRTLENPRCQISEQDYGLIRGDLKKFDGDDSNNKSLEKINSRMQVIKQEIVQHEQNDKSARAVNREGLDLARDKNIPQALDKFREAIRLMPRNPNYKLNAVQLLLTDPNLKTDANAIAEAREYLDTINLEHTGKRWRLYRKLKEFLPDE
jgi:CheY-like chemotaxis protein/Flp pilus assembly protein TadD